MRTLEGTIISNRMSKTVVVRVDRLRLHPRYRKYQRVSKSFKAHAADAALYQIGDIVRIVETRPLSKDKRWGVSAVIRRAPSDERADLIEPAGSSNASGDGTPAPGV